MRVPPHLQVKSRSDRNLQNLKQKTNQEIRSGSGKAKSEDFTGQISGLSPQQKLLSGTKHQFVFLPCVEMKTLETQVFLSTHHYSSILKWTLISSWKHRAPNIHLLVVQSVGEGPFLPPLLFRTQSSSAARSIRKPILSYSQKFLLSLKTLSSLCSQQSRAQNKHWHVRLCEMTEWPCRLIKGSGVFHIQLKSLVWTRPVSVVSGTGCSWKTAVLHLTGSEVSLYPLEYKYTRCFGVLCTVKTTLVAWIVKHPP